MATNADDRTLRQAKWAPYLLAVPALIFIYLFFLVPLVTLLKISLSETGERGSSRVDFTWEWSNFSKAFTDFGEHLVRALGYAGVTTIVCILLAYPLAYLIAFKVGSLAQPAPRVGDGAVLHQLPVAHDRLAVAVRRQRSGARAR